MTIYHAFDAQGAFIAGDTETGLTCYSYPDSIRADNAKRHPERTAREAITGQEWRQGRLLQFADYDARNWGRLAALVL